MCVVLDTCALASIFNRNAADHSSFAPVLDAITNREIHIAIGGSNYLSELRKATVYLKILLELERRGAVKRFAHEPIDAAAARIKDAVSDKDFDDPHIAGLLE